MKNTLGLIVFVAITCVVFYWLGILGINLGLENPLVNYPEYMHYLVAFLYGLCIFVSFGMVVGIFIVLPVMYIIHIIRVIIDVIRRGI